VEAQVGSGFFELSTAASLKHSRAQGVAVEGRVTWAVASPSSAAFRNMAAALSSEDSTPLPEM
jgi:hypothetical protein